VLPLLPATCVLMAAALARSRHPERWLIGPVALLGILPLAVSVVPDAVARGLSHTSIAWNLGVIGITVAAAIGIAMALWLRSRALTVAVLLAAGGFFLAEAEIFPALDKTASARALWSSSHPDCAPVLARGVLYSLYYYSDKELPDCAIVDKKALTVRKRNDSSRQPTL